MGAGLICLGLVVVPVTTRGAQVLDVRIGEHPTFTRLVFEFDQAPTYFVERDSDGSSLLVRLDAHAVTELIGGHGRRIDSVELETTDYGSVARIRLSGSDAVVSEQVLSAPPRIVLDIGEPEPGSVGLADPFDGALPGARALEEFTATPAPSATSPPFDPSSTRLASEHASAPPDAAEPLAIEPMSRELASSVEVVPERNPEASAAAPAMPSVSGRRTTGGLLLVGALAMCLVLGAIVLRPRRRATSLAAVRERYLAGKRGAAAALPDRDTEPAFSDWDAAADPAPPELSEEVDDAEPDVAEVQDPPVGATADPVWEAWSRPRPRSGATTMASMSRER
jgi:hypothetical protein